MEEKNILEKNCCPGEWENFNGIEEKLQFLKDWGLCPKTFTEPKPLYYHGIRSLDKKVLIDVIGHDGTDIAVINLFGSPHKIHADYLKEMQPTKKEAEQLDVLN
ncbi:hypothetical protein [Faecalispora jeddahensis]|uniref:hypothetical protein n=1 Tax=Faecalispora jeddahensis TaxID=1414721 RepID=UPI001898A5E7|nr:hypothetical protein [Faecalispora jeddahensis]MDU6306667.1 hypothetical protein [Clostridium sp.]MDU6347406.1 hypothetical protein [Clostridium sp.]